jgi:hypothetical protein
MKFPVFSQLAGNLGSRDGFARDSLLQRRVRLSPVSAFEGREPRLSAPVCAAGLGDRVGRDAQGFPFRANRRQYLCRAIFQYRSAADVGGENAKLVPTKSGLLWISGTVDL